MQGWIIAAIAIVVIIGVGVLAACGSSSPPPMDARDMQIQELRLEQQHIQDRLDRMEGLTMPEPVDQFAWKGEI